jgi:hypothetical protein
MELTVAIPFLPALQVPEVALPVAKMLLGNPADLVQELAMEAQR